MIIRPDSETSVVATHITIVGPDTMNVKAGFHMSAKSQMIGDFTVSRPSQILPYIGKLWDQSRLDRQ